MTIMRPHSIFTTKSILFMSLYGICFSISSKDPNSGLQFLLIAAIIFNLYDLLKRLFWGVIIGTFLTILGLLIPILLPFILLLPVIFRFTQFLKNIHLIFIGISLYFTAYYLPVELNEITESIELLTFLIGFAIMFMVYLVLSKMGASINDISFFTIGIPAYLLLLLIPFVNHNSHYTDNNSN